VHIFAENTLIHASGYVTFHVTFHAEAELLLLHKR